MDVTKRWEWKTCHKKVGVRFVMSNIGGSGILMSKLGGSECQK